MALSRFAYGGVRFRTSTVLYFNKTHDPNHKDMEDVWLKPYMVYIIISLLINKFTVQKSQP